MNKIRQQAQVLVEVSKHYDKNPKDAKLKEQMLYLLASLDKQMKNVK